MVPEATLALGMTLVIESFLAAIYCSWRSLQSCSQRRLMMGVLALNLISHPIGCVCCLLSGQFWFVEMVVVLGEAAGFALVLGLNWKSSISLSLLINGGTILFSIWW